jgi:5'-3' exonuclease
MINLLFDTNNIFFRSTFTVGQFGKAKYTFDNQTELDQLMRKVAMDVSAIIRSANPSRVIFAQDSKSWRKQIKIDENEGYKGNRKKNEFINWNNIFSIMDEFMTIIKDNSFITSKIHNAEADDLLALWSDELLNNKNEHVIIVSGDEDIRQLVKTVKTNNKLIHITVFNPFMQGKNASKKLYVSGEFEAWLNDESDPGDFFNRAIDIDKEDFQKLLNEKVKLQVLNGNDIALWKIFCGDNGDNVPAIYTWLTKDKSGKPKEMRITDSKYEKIKLATGINTNEDLNKSDMQNQIYKEIQKICEHEPTFKISERILRQQQLIVLDKSLFPKQIVQDFNLVMSTELNKPHVRTQSTNLNSILEGTKYVDSNYKKQNNVSSIFNQIDKISTKELF